MRKLVLAAAVAAALTGCSSDSPVAPSASDAAAAAVVRAQASVLRSLEPDADFADLDAFGRAVGDRPIVILGESTHGDGDIFKLKARLVRYLHEAKGFDVLLMESGLFDTARMRERHAAEGKSLSALAPGRMFFMYSKTDDGQRALQYVDASESTARPMQFMGFDISMGGDASAKELMPMLAAFLNARSSTIPASADWAAYQSLGAQIAALNGTPRPDDAKLAAFKRVSALLDAELCATQPDEFQFTRSPGFWCRITRGIAAGSERFWGPVDLRDRTAGDNVKWLLDHHFAGKKVVLWMHSFHGINGQAFPPSGPTWVSMGTRIVEHVGADKVFMTHFTLGEGPFDNYLTATPPSVPPLAEGMLEFHLAGLKAPSFIGWPEDAAARSTLHNLSVFEPDIRLIGPNHFGTGYQGVFFIPKTRPVMPDADKYPLIP
jgi:erythromycin esterase-like protein